MARRGRKRKVAAIGAGLYNFKLYNAGVLLTAAQRRHAWDEKELARIPAAQRHGLTTREIARRFDCNAGTIAKKLHELRAAAEARAEAALAALNFP